MLRDNPVNRYSSSPLEMPAAFSKPKGETASPAASEGLKCALQNTGLIPALCIPKGRPVKGSFPPSASQAPLFLLRSYSTCSLRDLGGDAAPISHRCCSDSILLHSLSYEDCICLENRHILLVQGCLQPPPGWA